MDYTPNIAVLMATYNGLDWIGAQIESIQNQINVNISIIFSDDQSTDGTKIFIEDLTSKEISHRLLPSTEKFGSAGANFLRLLKDIDFSSFDYVAFSDQDDIWLENKLFEAIKLIKSNEVEGYSGNVTAFWPDGVKKLICKSQPQKLYDYMFESAGPGCSFVFTKKLATDLQAFLRKHTEEYKEVALHDWFVYAYARAHGYKWHIDKVPYVLYRQHNENALGANVGIAAKKQRWEKLREGWHRYQVILLARLLEYDTEFPIKALIHFSFIDRLYLIVNIKKFRRSFIDAIALAAFFLLPTKK